jgi:hypothetical protein
VRRRTPAAMPCRRRVALARGHEDGVGPVADRCMPGRGVRRGRQRRRTRSRRTRRYDAREQRCECSMDEERELVAIGPVERSGVPSSSSSMRDTAIGTERTRPCANARRAATGGRA